MTQPLVRSEGRKALVGGREFLSPEVGDSTATIFLKLL